MKKKFLVLLAAIASLPSFVLADTAASNFVGNFIPDAITQSLNGMQVFFYQFMTVIFDIFTILLFVIWIMLIVGVIWSIYFLATLPKQIGAKSYPEAVMKIGFMLWEFMRFVE